MPAVGIVEDDRAFHDASGHAPVHASAPLLTELREGLPTQFLEPGRFLAAVVLGRHASQASQCDDTRGCAVHAEALELLVLLHHLGPFAQNLTIGVFVCHRNGGRTLVVHHDRLQPLRAHDSAHPPSSRVPGGVPVLVREGHGSGLPFPLPRGSDADHGSALSVLFHRFHQGIRLHALACTRILQGHSILVDQEQVQLVILRRPFDHDRPNPQLVQLLSRGSARIRFLDAHRERALSAHRDAAAGRGHRSRERPARNHEFGLRAERVRTSAEPRCSVFWPKAPFRPGPSSPSVNPQIWSQGCSCQPAGSSSPSPLFRLVIVSRRA